MFVSDVMERDVRTTLAWIAERNADLGARLENALRAGVLRVHPHPFFTSPLPMWEAPEDVQAIFRGADLAVFKGDGTIWSGRRRATPTRESERRRGSSFRVPRSPCSAANYRRLVGDRAWPAATPFADVVRSLPCPVLALRTCKAEVLVGVPDHRVDAARTRHPRDWCVSGTYGVVQLSDPEER